MAPQFLVNIYDSIMRLIAGAAWSVAGVAFKVMAHTGTGFSYMARQLFSMGWMFAKFAITTFWRTLSFVPFFHHVARPIEHFIDVVKHHVVYYFNRLSWRACIGASNLGRAVYHLGRRHAHTLLCPDFLRKPIIAAIRKFNREICPLDSTIWECACDGKGITTLMRTLALTLSLFIGWFVVLGLIVFFIAWLVRRLTHRAGWMYRPYSQNNERYGWPQHQNVIRNERENERARRAIARELRDNDECDCASFC